jgi:hypothetical protein
LLLQSEGASGSHKADCEEQLRQPQPCTTTTTHPAHQIVSEVFGTLVKYAVEGKDNGRDAVHLPLQLQMAGAIYPCQSFLHQQQSMINVQIDELKVPSSNQNHPEALRFANARPFETLFCTSLSKPLLFAYRRRTLKPGRHLVQPEREISEQLVADQPKGRVLP